MDTNSDSTTNHEELDLLRENYDFSRLGGGVRGKYATRYREGTNLVLLAPDVAAAFHDSAAVNEALRRLLHQERDAA